MPFGTLVIGLATDVRARRSGRNVSAHAAVFGFLNRSALSVVSALHPIRKVH
jgi:hypothetical protein